MRVQLVCEDESLTKQSFKDEADINFIIKKFKKTGLLSHVSSDEPKYGDFSDVPDFHTAMNIVASAQQAFDELPALVRKRFANDPAQMLDFVSDESNRDEAIKLGLLSAPISAPNVAPLTASADSE